MDGTLSEGPTLVFDGGGYYMGGVIAEQIRDAGHDETYVTPSDSVSHGAGNTPECWRIRSHMLARGIRIETAQTLIAFDSAETVLECA